MKTLLVVGLLALVCATHATQTDNRPKPSTCATTRSACQNLDPNVVTAINQQIKEEFTASYFYMQLYSYFSRDDVALRGFAKFFKAASSEERDHGMALLDYVIKRGGDVQFFDIPVLTSIVNSAKSGIDEALKLEKIVNGKLLDLHWTAAQANDPDLTNLLESDFLNEQVEAIKKLSDWSSILARFGTNKLGIHVFDQELYDGKR